jgi:hypothetical protein
LVSSKIGLVTIPQPDQPPPPDQGPRGAPAGATPYEAACLLEKNRRFVESLCFDLQGRLWIGCEQGVEGTREASVGGVQCWDPTKPPLEAVCAFTERDGLGDDNVYALACDLQGRIWAGHLNHGVSVYDGRRWQNYEVVGGATHDGSRSGPLGERVWRIVVCPELKSGLGGQVPKFKDAFSGVESSFTGSVWLCTSAGLTVYFPDTDTWSYLTRADGLPSDQPSAVAFGPGGIVYVGTQCDGIAVGKLADGCRSWRRVTAPPIPPATPAGEGLPSDLIEDLLVTRTGTVYAATTAGVAWSEDDGRGWRYLRGRDWKEKALLRIAGVQPGWDAPTGRTVIEDYCTRLGESASGAVYLGHRRGGLENISAAVGPAYQTSVDFVTSVAVSPSGMLVAGSYGDGVTCVERPVQLAAGQIGPLPVLPTGAPAPTEAVLRSVTDALTRPQAPASPVTVLAPDWQTKGTWLGRYGRFWMVHAACTTPTDFYWGTGAASVQYSARLGPGAPAGDNLRGWVSNLYTSDPRSLELTQPYLESRIAQKLTTPERDRRQSEWDDHGEGSSMAKEGPGVACAVTVPTGTFVLALYNVNENGKTGVNRYRDYYVTVREIPDGLPLQTLKPIEDGTPVLAHARVTQHYGGVYTRFLVRGPRRLLVHVDRNYSMNTNVNGIFLDYMDEDRGLHHNLSRTGLTSPVTGGTPLPGPANDLMRAARVTEATGAPNSVASARVAYALLARHLAAGRTNRDLSALASCYFRLGMYQEWEDARRKLGAIPPRDLEKATHWNEAMARLYPAMNADLIKLVKLSPSAH